MRKILLGCLMMFVCGNVFADPFTVNAVPRAQTGNKLVSGSMTDDGSLVTISGDVTVDGDIHSDGITVGGIGSRLTFSTGQYIDGATSGKTFLNGNVGIGTTVSTNRLNITGDATNELISLVRNTNTTYGAAYSAVDNVGNKYASFGVCNSGTGSAPEGYISYGNPGEVFVRGSGSSAGLVIANSSTSSSSATRFISGGGASTTEKMRITYSGNVGVGTTTPSEKMQIDGSLYISAIAASIKIKSSDGTVWTCKPADTTGVFTCL